MTPAAGKPGVGLDVGQTDWQGSEVGHVAAMLFDRDGADFTSIGALLGAEAETDQPLGIEEAGHPAIARGVRVLGSLQIDLTVSSDD